MPDASSSPLARAVLDAGSAVVADYDASGVRARALAACAGTTELTWLVVAPGGSLGEHAAGRDQVLVVVEGSGWLDVEGARIELAAGEAGLVRAGERHAKGSSTGMVALVVQSPHVERNEGAREPKRGTN